MATTVEQLSYNSPDGSNWGQSASEKIAAFGATPVTQRSAGIQASSFISVSSNATVGTTIAAWMSEVSQTLQALGFWKGS